ncbi:MAG: MFS transporter [Cruoricaptor ignavus]|nr:MFS transporter [Cruoricaptor ignavus]MDO5616476.1 MFS transporter [Cruoricaptor ignavus]
MQKKFVPLALGGLAIGTTEFVIMGLLPDVATSLQIDIPTAGHLISSYALGVVIGAPVLVALSGKYPPKKVLMALMVLFTIFNGLSALSPSYYTLLFARFFSGLPHGAFFGIGTVVAVKLAQEGKQAQAIAAMFSGLTIANLAMVPLVTYLGHNFGWRLAFGIVAILGMLCILFLKLWLPDVEKQHSVGIREQLHFFKTKKAWNIIGITAIGFGGLFAWFSYIAPLLTSISGFRESSISYIMVLAGAGMVVGNYLGGILADKIKPIFATMILLLSMVLALVAVFLFSGNPYISLVLTFVCGALSMSVGSPINIIMLRAAEGSEMLAAAVVQAAFNIANSLGAFFGGIPLVYGLSYNYPSLVGAGMAIIGFSLAFVFYNIFEKNRISKKE